MARKNAFVKMGRPPAPMSAAGVARPKMGGAPKMGGVSPAGAKAVGMSPGFGPSVGAGTPPMDGFNSSIPGAAFRHGGHVGHAYMPHHHDDARHTRHATHEGHRHMKHTFFSDSDSGLGTAKFAEKHGHEAQNRYSGKDGGYKGNGIL